MLYNFSHHDFFISDPTNVCQKDLRKNNKARCLSLPKYAGLFFPQTCTFQVNLLRGFDNKIVKDREFKFVYICSLLCALLSNTLKLYKGKDVSKLQLFFVNYFSKFIFWIENPFMANIFFKSEIKTNCY